MKPATMIFLITLATVLAIVVSMFLGSLNMIIGSTVVGIVILLSMIFIFKDDLCDREI